MLAIKFLNRRSRHITCQVTRQRSKRIGTILRILLLFSAVGSDLCLQRYILGRLRKPRFDAEGRVFDIRQMSIDVIAGMKVGHSVNVLDLILEIRLYSIKFLDNLAHLGLAPWLNRNGECRQRSWKLVSPN